MKFQSVKLISIEILLLISQLTLGLEIKEKTQYAGLEKISDDLYVGKVADEFYLAMERVDSNNIDMWLQYAKEQVKVGNRLNLKYLRDNNESENFKKVIEDYRYGEIKSSNELWIVYASNIPVVEKTKSLSYKKYERLSNTSNPHIEMFATVVTSPNAIITSHMGTSRTWEAALELEQERPIRKEHPNQSVYLHSFAAKVMKMRDPNKKYMITAPVPVMRNILIKNMPPHSVFVGDNLYREQIEAAEKDPKTLLLDIDLEEQEGETAEEREARLEKMTKYMYDYYQIEQKISLLKTHQPRIIRIRDGKDQKFIIQDSRGEPVVEFDQSTQAYQWMFTEAYKDFGLRVPYTLVDLDELARIVELKAGLKQISDDLYVGKVADEFYLAMERVDSNNIDMWLQYAREQVGAGKRMSMHLRKYLHNTDGSEHFKLVIEDYKYGEIKSSNELWIAYASNLPITKKAYLETYAPYSPNPKNPHIEMFVTVVTSPNAIITSHMGISRTWEAALELEQELPIRKKHPNQSVHLHSFAAKVMKMRDPNKKYMITAPVPVMRNILIKNMPPHSVFVGDNLYRKKIEAAEKDPRTLLRDIEQEEGETAEEREARLEKEAKDFYDYIEVKEKIHLLKTHPPRIFRIRDGKNQKFIIQDSHGKSLVEFDQSTQAYQWMFTEGFIEIRELLNPYVLVDLDALAKASKLIAD